MQELKKTLTTLESFIKHRPVQQRPVKSRDIIPLLEEMKKTIQEANKEVSSTESYFKRIYYLTENYKVEPEYAKMAHQEKSLLMNTSVSCTWIIGYFDRLSQFVYEIEDDINKKLEDYKELASKYNVDIDKNIDNIKNNIIEYKKSDLFKSYHDQSEPKIQALNDLIHYFNVLDKESFKLSLKNELPAGSFFIGQNYPTDFRKSPELNELVELLDKIKEQFKEYYINAKKIIDDTALITLIDTSDIDFKDMYSKLREAGYISCMANKYEENLKDKSVLGFLKNKDEETTDAEITIDAQLPEWSKTSKMLLFRDYSLLLIDKENKMREIVSIEEAKKLKKTLIQEYIQQEFSRKPTIGKLFKNMNAQIEINEISSLERVINTYLKNEGILKLYNFDIAKNFENAVNSQKESYRIFENFDDNMSKIIHTHKVKKFIHEIASNKYDHLYNDETYKLASEIYDLDLPDNSLQDYIGKKLAAFKTPEQFNEALGLFLESLNSFTMVATLNKAKTYGVDVISENDNKLILKINSFEQSKIMGSSAWCICRTESYFNSYATDREQYFLYDFSKDTTDLTSLIGVTLEVNGDYSVACYKDDTECEEDDPMISYVQEEVYEYKENMEVANKKKLKI